MNTPLSIENQPHNENKALNLLLCFITDVASTIRFNTPYYQGNPMPSETPSNVLWLSEVLAGLGNLTKALRHQNTNDVAQEVDNLVNYWTFYRDEIESARENTAGDNLNWSIEDGLNILNLLKSTHCTPTN